MTAILTRIFSFLIAMQTMLCAMFGWGGQGEVRMYKNGSLACADALGREVVSSCGQTSRQVGIFYFLWQGEHGTGGPYDNSKIVAAHPEAVLSEANWRAAGGGAEQEHHFWGEPLFGYYTSKDKWVMRKHLQMLTDAGVDFLVMDTTNAVTYSQRVKDLIDVWYPYLVDGWDVPRIAFYTNTVSGLTMNRLYDELYADEQLKNRYPRLEELWFTLDGKPMIVGKADDPDLRPDVKAYFRIKESQWPTEGRKADGFPWMEFDRSLTYKAVYGKGLRREIMSVSAAQHADTCRFSATAWYGANDRTRSWSRGANNPSDDAYLYGYNFAEQWEFAFRFSPDMVFVTGFNEWVAQRQPGQPGEPVVFVDCADINNSRDIEPMRGGFGDNYYMQLVHYIALFKSTDCLPTATEEVVIDMTKGFGQWNNPAIKAVYEDYRDDVADRDSVGFGHISYKDTSGRNDFVTLKVAKDSANVYFYAQTAQPIVPASNAFGMALLIKTGAAPSGENGYDYLIKTSRGAPAEIFRIQATSLVSVGFTDCAQEDDRLMVRVPRTLLEDGGTLDIQFKWIDGCDPLDVFTFYTNGDCAPYGRLNFVFR